MKKAPTHFEQIPVAVVKRIVVPQKSKKTVGAGSTIRKTDPSNGGTPTLPPKRQCGTRPCALSASAVAAAAIHAFTPNGDALNMLQNRGRAANASTVAPSAAATWRILRVDPDDDTRSLYREWFGSAAAT